MSSLIRFSSATPTAPPDNINTSSQTPANDVPQGPDLYSQNAFPVGKPWQPPSTRTLSQRQRDRLASLDGKYSLTSVNGTDAASNGNATSSNVRDHSTVESEDLPSLTVPRHPKSPRQQLLHIIGETHSPLEAWQAYCNLLAIPRNGPGTFKKPWIPFAHLHRLSRLLARSRLKSRLLFLRLLSVLKTIRRMGGRIHLDEWNALISSAGSGWRRTSLEDFQLSLDIFNDMILQREPGETSSGKERPPDVKCLPAGAVKPDIVTYTALLDIAARTNSLSAIQHAIGLLKASGIPPNRITHLSLLKHFTHTTNMAGLRSTLSKMREQGLELGLDGINACLWFCGRSDRIGLALKIYRVLHDNVVPRHSENDNDIGATLSYLDSVYGIVVPSTIVPNAITYITMIQILAYHGYFSASLDVFIDMLSSKNEERTAPLFPDENGKLVLANYSPSFPAFRALFLGFARHAVSPSTSHVSASLRPTWTLENLEPLFKAFLVLPENDEPHRGTLYWIIVAFQKTSRNDVAKLRQVWRQLETKYPWPWADPGNRLSRLREEIFASEEKS